MAQNDIIDLDALLDDYEAGLLAQSAAAQAQKQQDEDIELQKLTEFGYVKPKESLYDRTDYEWSPSQFSGVTALMKDNFAKDQARRAGIMADDPYAIENWLPEASPQLKAEYTGVDFTAGAQGDVIRQIELLPADVRSDSNYVQRVLQKNYAEDHDIPRTYDYNVRVEPNTGDMIFNDPLNNNQPTVINPPGMNKGDFLAFAEPVAAEVGAAIGGAAAGIFTAPVTGGAVNPVTLGLLSEIAATYFWRLNNLEYLDEQGYLPEGYDINTRAMKDAGMTAAFSVGGVGLFKILKRLAGVTNLPSKFLIKEDEFLESYKKLEEAGEDVAAMTSPQVLIRGAEEGVDVKSRAAAAEAGLRDEANIGSKQGQQLSEKYGAQEDYIREAVDEPFTAQGITREIVEEEAGAGARATRGTQYREAAQETLETNPRLVEAEKAITDLNTQSDNLFRGISDGSIDPNLAGKQIRETFETAKETAQKTVDEAYEEATRLAGFKGNMKPYDYTPLLKPARRFKNIMDQQAFADPRSKRIIADVLASVESGAKKSHDAFRGDLTSLRGIIRAERLAGNNIEELVRLQKVMESIRAKTLKDSGSPDALRVFNEAEASYRQLMERFNNDQIGRMLNLQNVSNTAYRQGDKTAYNGFMNFLRNNITKNADGTISSPTYIDDVLLDPTHLDGLLGIKGGLRQTYMDKVIDTTGDVFKPRSPKAHADFMRDNKSLLEKFFTEDEMAEFANAGKFIENFKARERALAQTRDAILRNTNLSDIAGNFKTPEDLFKNTWTPGGFTATKELFDAVTTHGSKDLIDTYKSYIFKDIMDNTSRQSQSLGQKIFDGTSLQDYLGKHGDAMEIWFGKKFVTQLDGIAKKIKSFDDPKVRAMMAEDPYIFKSVNSLARAYVGLFTTPGRVMTAVKNIAGGAADNKELALLIDPDKLYTAIVNNQWQKNPVVKGLVRELGRIYYREWEDPDDELTSDVSAQETLMFGPGYQIQEEQRNFNIGGHVIKDLGIPLKYGVGK
jgi:hypothetical protein